MSFQIPVAIPAVLCRSTILSTPVVELIDAKNDAGNWSKPNRGAILRLVELGLKAKVK
jgi:hypothetical protein